MDFRYDFDYHLDLTRGRNSFCYISSEYVFLFVFCYRPSDTTCSCLCSVDHPDGTICSYLCSTAIIVDIYVSICIPFFSSE